MLTAFFCFAQLPLTRNVPGWRIDRPLSERRALGRNKTIDDTELLAHARRVFLEKGAQGSTKEIARSAGISEAVLFQRFPTKATLFLAAMVPPQVDADAIVQSGAKYSDPQDALCAMCDSMLVYFRSMMPIVLHLLTHPSITMEDIMSHFEKSASASLPRALSKYLTSLQGAGKVHVNDPDSAASLLISSIHSVAIFEMLGAHGGHFPEAGVRALVAAFWHGLAPRR
ncbi:TetR/AcrR family transcriptional regulator [Piscinibacter terrae]|uniref:TetR/AcrR family transcriptional regulator n=1 Tax=Piscinibacter terrae TaxID=2496871 RepID=A0A3N7HKP2_9BURK|nr:TetR/AcrR family transcriptional regulator [Albitalea terrae]RQP22657.1 TetR/AcrR family transcriptional regulator [Albitalea terrae]